MKTYQSHKIVKAAQITYIYLAPDDTVVLELDDGTNIDKPSGTNYSPVVGDYLVEYEDGYRSLSPKAVFEAGYSEIQPVT